MQFFFEVFVFLFGLAIGSFLNVVLLRFNTGESFARGRSRCFSCGKELRAFELVPVLSFVFLRGRCQRCQSKISFQYPLVEFLVGILYLLFFLKWERDFGSALHALPILFWWFVTGFTLIFLAVYDFRHKILPDAFNYSFIALSIVGNLSFLKMPILNVFISLIPALFLFLLWLLSRGRAMGLGDGKLMAGAGFFLGPVKVIEALFFGFWAGAIYGILLLLFRQARSMKAEIPFGPFLILGIVVSFFLPDILGQYFYII